MNSAKRELVVWMRKLSDTLNLFIMPLVEKSCPILLNNRTFWLIPKERSLFFEKEK
jgi:hypothetical protein